MNLITFYKNGDWDKEYLIFFFIHNIVIYVKYINSEKFSIFRKIQNIQKNSEYSEKLRKFRKTQKIQKNSENSDKVKKFNSCPFF